MPKTSLLLTALLTLNCGLPAAQSSRVSTPQEDEAVWADARAALKAAYDERNTTSCASARARRLFARASELGDRRGAFHLAESFDPNSCPQAGSGDPRRAAELYRAAAEHPMGGEYESLRDAVLAWTKLIEAGAALAAPFKTSADLLNHYGSVLAAIEYQGEKGVELLRGAVARGSDEAYTTLRAAAQGSNTPGGLKRGAAYALAQALRERYPGGERNGEIVELLIQSNYEWAALEAMEPMLLRGKLDESAQRWLLQQLPTQAHSLKAPQAVTDRLLAQLSAPGAAAESRAAARDYLYRVAARPLRAEPGTLAVRWQELLANLGAALALDGLAHGQTRHADALYAVVANVEGSGVLVSEKKAALQSVASAYHNHAEALTDVQLARLAVLSWHGLAPDTSAAATRALFEALAARGDAAARNTLRVAEVLPHLFQVSAANLLTAVDEFTTTVMPHDASTLSRRPGACGEENLAGALDMHTALHEELMVTRGVSEWDRDRVGTEDLPLNRISNGSGVAVFARDDLSTCVWLLQQGSSVFEAIYLPADFVRAQLNDFLLTKGILTAAKARSPITRANQDTVGPDPLSLFLQRHRSGEGDPLRALTAALFPAAAGAALREIKALTIVPLGGIGVIPFPALPLPGTRQVLLDQMSVAVAPNLTDVFAASLPDRYARVAPGCDQAEPRGSAQPLARGGVRALVVGDPDYARDPEFVFPQLPGARREAVSVAQLLATRPLIGKAATVEAVAAAAQESELLYFATHGVASEKSGLEGFVALAEGGRLTAKSVQEMCLQKARLVVLSACQTGLGQAVGGGVIGLARAFQIAGVPDVVMSLWNVDDNATRLLMTRFVSEITKGVSTRDALRNAMLALRATHPNPRYWASFTIMAEGMGSWLDRAMPGR